MAKIRKKIIEFPNSVPTTGSAFLYAKKNPNDTYTTSNVTLEQMVTLLNGLLTPGGGGGISSVLYSQVFFVDTEYGDDLTAAYGNFTKPFASISAALSAAELVGYSASSRGLIYVRRGEYYGNNSLRNYVDVYFEPNATLFGEINDSLGAVDSRIYGNVRFRGARALNLLNESNIHLEFDNAEVNGNFMITAPSTFLNLYLIGNYIKSNSVGSGYACTLRGAAHVNFNLRQYATCLHTFFDIRNSYSGTLNINIPEIHLATGSLYGVDYKQCIFIRSSLNATINIKANLINDATGWTNMYGLLTINGSTNLKINLTGNIDSLDGTSIQCAMSDADSLFTYTGIITSKNKVLHALSDGKVKFNNVHIYQTTDVIKNVIQLDNTTTVMFNNVFMRSESTTNNFIASSSDTNRVICINTYAFNTTTLTKFAKGVTTWTIRATNCVSNVNLDATTTDISTPTGFILDAGFTLI